MVHGIANVMCNFDTLDMNFPRVFFIRAMKDDSEPANLLKEKGLKKSTKSFRQYLFFSNCFNTK
jgi:hypothetical protein